MRRSVAWLVLGSIGAAREARAGADDGGATAAPAPATLPELTAGARVLAVAAIATTGDLSTIAVSIGGTYAPRPDLELFASIAVRTTVVSPWVEDGIPSRKETSLGNLRAGARYLRRRGDITIAPSAFLAIPTGAQPRDLEGLARMDGLADARAFVHELAVGLAVDAAWRTPDAFAQAELGAAVVRDRGPQIASVFGAVAAGRRLTCRLGLVGAWRVEAFPHAWIHMPMLGLGIDGDRGTTWSVSVQPAIGPGFSFEALAISVRVGLRLD